MSVLSNRFPFNLRLKFSGLMAASGVFRQGLILPLMALLCSSPLALSAAPVPPASVQAVSDHAIAVHPTASGQSQRVATLLPVTDLLTRTLLADTPVAVDYLPNKRYPVGRVRYWLDKKLPETLSELPLYTALVEIASVWPEGSAYSALRQQNIRLIPVDAAVQLKPEGARISLGQGAGELDYFWLNSANLKVMLAIVAEDLSRIWPDYQAKISANLTQATRAVTVYSLALDDLLWQQAWDGLCAADPALQPMVQSLSLPVVSEGSCLRLSEEGGVNKKAESAANESADTFSAVWTLNSLNRHYPGTLSQWLESHLQQLAAVKAI